MDIQHTGPDPRRSYIFVGVGVLVTALLGAFVSARVAAFAVAAVCAAAGTWRLLGPAASRAAGIAVRGRVLDVTMYYALAAGIAFLAATLPDLG
ncbi:MAG: DUF3017 domain-containing protein [Cellulomonadaceae bacterium]|jgi:hypothetical protein|nr:DUF3017 domain-containing protein [Cellulomonadaceae bacterium]